MINPQVIKSRVSKIFLFALCIMLIGQISLALPEATTSSPERGYKAGRSYSISDIENVGLYSGDLGLNIPLGSLAPGRGGMSAAINLLYSSKIWDVYSENYESTITTHPKKTFMKSEDGGWRYAYKYQLKIEYLRLPPDQGYCTSGINESFEPYKLQLVTPDGGKHALAVGTGSTTNEEGFMNIWPDGRPACGGTNPDPGEKIVYFTTDSTYYRLELITDSDTNWQNNKWTLYAADGSTVSFEPVSGVYERITDRNGNYIDVKEIASDSNYSNHRTTTLIDQLSRKVVIEYNAATNEDWIHSKGFDGADIVTKVRWKNITVNKTYFAGQYNPDPGTTDWHNFPLNETFTVVDKIYLPTQISGNLYYEFGYNADGTTSTDVGWGEINSVRLPSEAVAEYSYYFDNVTGSSVSAEDVILNRPIEKELHYDLEYDGGTTATTDTWVYTPITLYNALPNLIGMKVTGPDGSETTEHYATDSLVGPPTIPAHVRGESYKMEGPDGSKVEKFYTSNVPVNPNQLNKANRYVKYEFSSPKDASGNFTQTAIKEFTQDKNGNTTEVKEYDFVTYSTVPRDSDDRPTGLPSGISSYLKRISQTEFYNPVPEASAADYSDADSYHLASSERLLRLAKSSEIQDASATPKSRSEITYDYTNYDSSNTKAGNPTETKTWDSFKGGQTRAYSNPLTSTNSISTSTTYNLYGMPLTTTDANGVVTTITYGCVDGNMSCAGTLSNLYPTKTETASNYSTLKRTSTAVYDFYTGLVTSSTDVDNNLTNATEYDALGRPKKSIVAQGTALESWTTTDYYDAGRYVVVKSDLAVKGDGKKVATQFYDQLGRVRLSKTLEDAATQSAINETDGIKVETRYQTGNPNSYQITSNPFRAATAAAATNEPTMGWTRSKSWNTGRKQEVETFSGASLPAPWGTSTSSTGVVQTDIDANATTVTDQAGKQRISRTNALGQLKDIWEVTASDANTEAITFGNPAVNLNGYKTSYNYDTLSNLTTVNQGVQTRSFTYSSLSRLMSATNPESGLIQYVYDNNGNLTSKTDARGVKTDYVYDALNRVTNRNYSTPGGTPANYQATPDVSYFYDNLTNAKGKLIKVTNGTGIDRSTTEYTSFDILGRVTASKQTTDGVTYGNGTTDSLMTYSYNLGGALIEQQYPSGRKVQNTLDANGDLEMVKSRKNANSGYWAYANNFTYNPAGAVTSMQLGNGRWESTVFNSRLQPTQIALGTTPNATDALKLEYGYGTTANNGNVASQKITVVRSGLSDLVFDQTYTYDSLNRLQVAEEKTGTTTNWNQTFTFDRYGNRNFNQSLTTAPSFTDPDVTNPGINTSNNRLSSSNGYVYDAAGNVTTDADGRTFTYDAENKQVEAKNASSVTLGTYYFDGDGKRVKKVVPSTGETTIFVYDAAGKQIAEYSTVVAATNDAKVQYLTSDNLGTPRINTDRDGNVVSRSDYMPYGEEIVGLGGRSSDGKYIVDDVRLGFTGYEKDGETGLSYAKARMYSDALGRFASVDPMALKKAFLSNPQNTNRYAYTRNNPLTYVDSTGLCSVPSGLKKGQVGICIEAFIAAPRVGPGGIGYGDGRSTQGDGRNADLTNRLQVQLVFAASKDGVELASPPSITHRSSRIMVGMSYIGDRDKSTGQSGTTKEVVVALPGSSSAKWTYNREGPAEDFGTTTVNVSGLGYNGIATLGRSLQKIPFIEGLGQALEEAAPGPIQYNLNFTISGSGQVEFTSGESKGFPTYAAYSYTIDDNDNVQTNRLLVRPENKIEDLDKPMTQIPH